MRRSALLGALCLALAVPSAAPAGILAPEDATEAANALADAQEEQGVCYGWRITNDFDGYPDIGSSSGGPDTVVDPTNCRLYVILEGNIHYACSTCEDSDSAYVSIDSNLTTPPTEEDLRDLGLDADALTGDDDDVTLLNMIGALPLLAAQTGAVPAIPAETPESVPAGDVPTNQPGSDFMRENWLKLVLFLFLLAGGPCLWLYKRSQEQAAERAAERKRKRKQQRQQPPPPNPNPTEA